jgi:exosortase/archaeosortase family protein
MSTWFLLGTPQFAVAIYPACAEYEGIGLISVFVGSYLWLFRGSLRFPQAFILLPCGILVIWLVNAVRITLLVLFGALHGRWLAGTVAGMFYAWAMYRRGRVGDAIMAHATTNALIAAEVLLFGNWNLWN